MRRFLLIASAAAVALIGLSANQCGGGDDKQATPETPPAETPAPATPPAESAPPAESPPPAEPPAQQ